MSQMINVSEFVNDVEIKNYVQRVMFDSFKAQILKNISAVKTHLFLFKIEQSKIKSQTVLMKTTLTEHISN